MIFEKMNAWTELQLEKTAKQLLIELLEQDISFEQAQALAYNAGLVFYTQKEIPLENPMAVFRTFSLQEIAQLCGDYNIWNREYLEHGKHFDLEEEIS